MRNQPAQDRPPRYICNVPSRIQTRQRHIRACEPQATNQRIGVHDVQRTRVVRADQTTAGSQRSRSVQRSAGQIRAMLHSLRKSLQSRQKALTPCPEYGAPSLAAQHLSGAVGAVGGSFKSLDAPLPLCSLTDSRMLIAASVSSMSRTARVCLNKMLALLLRVHPVSFGLYTLQSVPQPRPTTPGRRCATKQVSA